MLILVLIIALFGVISSLWVFKNSKKFNKEYRNVYGSSWYPEFLLTEKATKIGALFGFIVFSSLSLLVLIAMLKNT